MITQVFPGEGFTSHISHEPCNITEYSTTQSLQTLCTIWKYDISQTQKQYNDNLWQYRTNENIRG